jgi:hypothetical protein
MHVKSFVGFAILFLSKGVLADLEFLVSHDHIAFSDRPAGDALQNLHAPRFQFQHEQNA